jgi:hypothetical protein
MGGRDAGDKNLRVYAGRADTDYATLVDNTTGANVDVLLPVSTFHPDEAPKAMLSLPLVTFDPEYAPNATVPLPLILLSSASLPTPVLNDPLLFADVLLIDPTDALHVATRKRHLQSCTRSRRRWRLRTTGEH